MTNSTHEQTVLVIRDEQGACYVLTDEPLTTARATEDQQAALDTAPRGDVAGFVTPIAIPGATSATLGRNVTPTQVLVARFSVEQGFRRQASELNG